MPRKRYWVYPYMIALMIFSAILFPGLGLIAYLSTRYWPLFVLSASMFPFIFFIEWLEGYRMLGWVTLDDVAVSLHAPFRKTLTLS